MRWPLLSIQGVSAIHRSKEQIVFILIFKQEKVRNVHLKTKSIRNSTQRIIHFKAGDQFCCCYQLNLVKVKVVERRTTANRQALWMQFVVTEGVITKNCNVSKMYRLLQSSEVSIIETLYVSCINLGLVKRVLSSNGVRKEGVLVYCFVNF